MRSPAARVSVLLLTILLTALIGRSVWQLAAFDSGSELPRLLQDNLAVSGVEHPVTAVLLNFRSYDTLLEIAVLVIAAMVGISMARTRSLEDPELRTADTLLRALLRWLVPLMLLLAAYLLWAGADRPGGAFQAGAILAATGVLMRLTGMPLDFLRPGLLLRFGLVLGFALFLLVGLASAIAGEAFLAYPPGLSKALILSIETLLTLSIGMILLALFVSAPANNASEPEEGEQ